MSRSVEPFSDFRLLVSDTRPEFSNDMLISIMYSVDPLVIIRFDHSVPQICGKVPSAISD